MAATTLYRRNVAWLAEHGAAVLLALTVSGLAAGGGLHLVGDHHAADVAWLTVAAVGLAYAFWTLADSLRRT